MKIILPYQLDRYEVGEQLLCWFTGNNDIYEFIGTITKVNLHSFRLVVIKPTGSYPRKGQNLTLKKQSTIHNHFREIDSFPYSYQTKQNFSEAEKKLIQAKRLVAKGKGILYRSSLGILKNAIRMAEEQGNYSDLFEFVEPLEKKYSKMKMEIDQKTERDKQKFSKMISEIVASNTKEQIRKKIAKLTDEWTVLFAKLNHPRNNIATKTQYEVKLNAKIDKNANERADLEYALKKYDQYKK